LVVQVEQEEVDLFVPFIAKEENSFLTFLLLQLGQVSLLLPFPTPTNNSNFILHFSHLNV